MPRHLISPLWSLGPLAKLARKTLPALLFGAMLPGSAFAQTPTIQPRATAGGTAGTRVTAPADSALDRVDPVSVLSLQLIATPSPVEREQIAHELARLGPAAKQALPALREVAELDPVFARMAVGRALWRIDGDVAPLIDACSAGLASDDASLRGRAASQLGDLGPAAASAAPQLRAALASWSPIVRVQAAEALLRISPDDLAPVVVLANELENPETGVAVQAAFALGETGPKHRGRAKAALASAAKNGPAETRNLMETLLADFGDVPVAPVAEPAPAVVASNTPTADDTRSIGNTVSSNTPSRRSRLVDPAEFTAPSAEERRLTLAAGRVDPRFDLDAPPERLAFDDDPAPAPPAAGPSEQLPAPVPETAPERSARFGRRSVQQISLDIAVQDEDLAKFAAERWADSDAVELAYEGQFVHGVGTTRPWLLQSCYWDSTGSFHQPLYFENPNSERYGLHHGKWIQPVVEAGRFYGNILILPYRFGSERFCERQYVLGHYRPGDSVPCIHQGTLRRSWRGAAFQAAAATGLVFIVP